MLCAGLLLSLALGSPAETGLLMLAGAQADDMADRSVLQRFLSKYMTSDTSKTSVDDYNKFMVHRFNNVKHGGAPDAFSQYNGPAEHGPAIDVMFDKSSHPTALAQDSMAFTSARGEPFASAKDRGDV